MNKAFFGWLVIGIFTLCSTINFLDRQLLAALAPTLKHEFHLSNTGYGEVVSAFAFTYALASPAAGWLIDRVGLNVGMSFAIALWSVAGILTAWTRSLSGLLGCRALLGAGESAGMPGLSKANALYLRPPEYPMSLAVNQIALSLGSTAAPLIAAWAVPVIGWRQTFAFCGGVGLLWVPLWLFVAKRGPRPAVIAAPPRLFSTSFFRDIRLWGLLAANALVMMVYSVWTNWTTLYLVQEHHLTAVQANQTYAWIPPIFATVGAFWGGWLSLRWTRAGTDVINGRLRTCRVSAAFLLINVAVPLMPSAWTATAAISASFFWSMSLQGSLHVLPIDLFGAGRAGIGASMLACSYGLVQMVISPAIGAVVDRFGFSAICVVLGIVPLIGIALFDMTLRIHRAMEARARFQTKTAVAS